ncbi:sulfate adenylyltransferase subunit CysN [Zeaxanthinibacter enoshimensis]|uniref:sulfate adenylyltransferase n=1 Tax=Zeaxanthinibacter enoshimensis TaxID=392009 RepID=A0A4R6TRN3_9FLAO|nr:sulfate adenylyltransferase subunit CysN [Zeaxanthinibacter enoshimensis]TDQ31150.1 sulfate adenylyltransferase subunit 1 [Zeaxanthinibacter enoshimensis]
MQINHNQLLRFTTAGSVDDGKSTLIGRLLYDSKSIFEDQMAAIENSSKKKGHNGIDLALFTDGLRDEREQGITIDVAYRYFTTPKRKFIIADTPGHIQYTRNMVTGASTANAAIILIDARHGVIEQTRRHTYIASLLKIPHLIICVNKMDLVDYDKTTFNNIVDQFKDFSTQTGSSDLHFIPISALLGDNVVNDSKNMPWYTGKPLLHTLETLDISKDDEQEEARFPVQTVLRPQREGFIDYRGYAGRIASGTLRVGDLITVLPSGLSSTIESITGPGGEIEEAFAPMSIALTLKDDIDISRGDMIVRTANPPEPSQDFEVMLCWLHNDAAKPRTKYTIKHTSNDQKAMIKEVLYKININNLEKKENDHSLQMNDISRVRIKTTRPLMVDPYERNRSTGSIILIDDATNETVAAGMIV